MTIRLANSREPGWDEGAWDAFVAGHAAAHPLQLRAWGQLKSEYGWEHARLGLFEQDRLLAGAQVLFHRLPRLGFLPWRLAYVPKGPLVDWGNKALAQPLLDGLWRFCLRRRALLLKIEPEAPDEPDLARQLSGLGLHPSRRTVQPQTTVWIDLQADEDTILAGMKQKWRYNVRLAARKGVSVRVGEVADLDAFSRLMRVTAARNEFGVHEPAYYRRFWELFAPGGQAALLLAEYEGQVLSGLMVAHLAGKAYYLYGASGNDDRNLMPNHLLQWETMRWARERGCTAYDLWGVPNEVGLDEQAPIPDPPVGLWGVWRFKRGFGGQVVRYTGAWDKRYLPVFA